MPGAPEERPRAAFFGAPAGAGRPGQVDYVYGAERRRRIAELTELHPHEIHAGNLDRLQEMGDLQVIFSTWGMPVLDAERLRHLPRLEAVFYAAGSVRGFAEPLLERGVLVTSAWAANAIPVAEFVLAQILLACKGYFRNVRDYAGAQQAPNAWYRGPGIFDVKVALIGAGQVGRALVERLRPFRLDVLVVDPYLSAEDAAVLRVRQVSLEQAFREAYVVSNHLPNIAETRGMLAGPLFEALQPGAVFINTGRGAQVVEADLARVLAERTDLTALLDVTNPEPPASDSPLWHLPNVHLSSHIAGALNNEVGRLADSAIASFLEWRSGHIPRYAVTAEMLERMA